MKRNVDPQVFGLLLGRAILCMALAVFATTADAAETTAPPNISSKAAPLNPAVFITGPRSMRVAPETIAGYRKVMLNFVENPPPGINLDEWATRQVYIALGTFMTAAAVMGVDACPLEGIQPEKYDEVLQLPQHGYATAVACAAGYRSEDDKYAQLAKVRFATEEMIVRI